MIEIVDRGAFPEKLGIVAHSEVLARLLARVFFQERNHHATRRPRQHCTAAHHDVELVLMAQGLADFRTDSSHAGQVRAAIGLSRRAHADQRHLRRRHRVLHIHRRTQGPLRHGLADHLGCLPLRDRRQAAMDHVHLRLVGVHTDDGMASRRQTGGAHEADVPDSNDAHPHTVRSLGSVFCVTPDLSEATRTITMQNSQTTR